ncbi:MAG: hypothetical protein ISN29_04070 [Gammaproteobacteria bacterium AqS3]|nr:hypothetical protein [Gammaproteobacteria bacterium AqS3]
MWSYLRENRRKLVDRTAAGVISLGGYSVIGIIALIFIFLFGQILPLFLPADEDALAEYSAPAPTAERVLLDEYGQTGLWLDAGGALREFSGESGELLETFPLLGTAP